MFFILTNFESWFVFVLNGLLDEPKILFCNFNY
jgi:hypothetical protein